MPQPQRYAGCIWTIVTLSSSSTPIALLLGWFGLDLQLLPLLVGGPEQSEALVQRCGNRILDTFLPCIWQWSSAPQSPWSTQSVRGSLAELRKKKSWSL